MRRLAHLLPLAGLLLSAQALADRGALTIEVGAGGAGTLLPAPRPSDFTLTAAKMTPITSGAAWLGARYALSNNIELTVTGFFEPAVQVFHNGVVLESTTPPASSFPGTLSHRDTGYGALAGVRWLHGDVWRVTASFEAGWARRSDTGFVHYDDRGTSGVADYRLALRDLAVDAAVLSVGGGLEWAFADKMSIAVQPRLQLAIGLGVMPSVIVPVVFSYSWFL